MRRWLGLLTLGFIAVAVLFVLGPLVWDFYTYTRDRNTYGPPSPAAWELQADRALRDVNARMDFTCNQAIEYMLTVGGVTPSAQSLSARRDDLRALFYAYRDVFCKDGSRMPLREYDSGGWKTCTPSVQPAHPDRR